MNVGTVVEWTKETTWCCALSIGIEPIRWWSSFWCPRHWK